MSHAPGLPGRGWAPGSHDQPRAWNGVPLHLPAARREARSIGRASRAALELVAGEQHAPCEHAARGYQQPRAFGLELTAQVTPEELDGVTQHQHDVFFLLCAVTLVRVQVERALHVAA